MLRTAVLTFAVLALAPAASHAATLTIDEHANIHYTAADGEENHVSMYVADVGYGMIRDTGAPGLTACGTVWFDPDYRACPNARRPVIALGDGNDGAIISDGGSEEDMWIGVTHVDAGPGDDSVQTAASNDALFGGDGNDTLRPLIGANRVEGGAGDDTLESFYGDDTKIGGPGADTFLGHDGNETIDAADGAGTDTITCGGGTDSVTADAGDSVSADCETVTRRTNGTTPPPQDPAPPPPAPEDPAPPPVEQPGHGGRPTVPPGHDRRPPKVVVKVKRQGARRFLHVTADESATLRGAGRARTLVAGRVAKIAVGRGRLKLLARDAAGNETVKRIRVR